MAIGARNWSSGATYVLVDMMVTATLKGRFWFGRSSRGVFREIAGALTKHFGQVYTVEDVMLKLNDLYLRHVTWQWVIAQEGLVWDPATQVLVGLEAVWSKIIRENPMAGVYKFNTEKYGARLAIMFGTPFKFKVGPEVDTKPKKCSPSAKVTELIEVVEVSDDDPMEDDDDEFDGAFVYLGEQKDDKDDETYYPTPSEAENAGYSTCSSPFPPKA